MYVCTHVILEKSILCSHKIGPAGAYCSSLPLVARHKLSRGLSLDSREMRFKPRAGQPGQDGYSITEASSLADQDMKASSATIGFDSLWLCTRKPFNLHMCTQSDNVYMYSF
jgi:hypothetical protein